jgi:hypothetical protein
MSRPSPLLRPLTHIALLIGLLVPAGCLPVVAVRELAYRPSPRDPYDIWRALITDSGLLVLCGSVDNGRESMEHVVRYYNLELRLEPSLEPPRLDAIQVVYINDDPSLHMVKGYLSDLCQFDAKRAKRKPDERGWTEIFLDRWDDGYAEVRHADLQAGRLPTPPGEPRVVLYEVYESDVPEYLLMGRLRKDGPEVRVLLVLGPEHIKAMW